MAKDSVKQTTCEPASEAPVRCSDLVRRLRDLEQYVDACDEAADWIEAAGKAILLYEKAVQSKCTCETPCGCHQCDMVIAARNLTGIEP